MAIRTIGVRLTAQITSYVPNIQKSALVTRELSAEVDNLGGKLEKLGKDGAASAGLKDAGAATAQLSKEMGGVAAQAGTAEAGLKKAGRAGKSLSDQVGSLGGAKEKFAPLIAGASESEAGLVKARLGARALGRELDILAVKSKEKFAKLTTGGLVLGAALLAPLVLSTHAAADFDREMSAVSSVMDKAGLSAGQVADQLDSLRTIAIKAGKDTAFSATEAATGEEELVKAGVSAKDIIGGGLTGALSLAKSGNLDLASAATDAAQAMNIFGLSGAAVPHIADVLTAAANASATDVDKLALSLNQSGLIAKQTGLDLEETAGSLALFAQNGLVSSDAGTSFKTMLQALQKPSGVTTKLMEKLGISAYDAKGNFIGIAGVAQNLQDKLGGLTPKLRAAAFAQIFGSDATRAANILYQQGAQGLDDWISKVEQQGIAEQTAAERMNNLSGDVEQLKGSLETLSITAGGGANKGLRVLTEAATGTVNAFLNLPPWISESATVLSGFGGVATVSTIGIVKARSAIKDLLSDLEKSGPAGVKASGLLGKLGKFAGVAGAVAAAGFVIYDAFSALSRTAGPATRNVDDLTTALAHMAETGQVTGELSKTFGSDLSGLNRDAQTILTTQKQIDAIRSKPFGGDVGVGGKGGGHAAPDITADLVKLGTAQNDFKGTDEGLANLVNNGQIRAASTSFDALRDSMLASGYSMDFITGLFPQYTKVAGDAASQSSLTAQGFGTITENLSVMSTGMADAISKGQTLLQVENQLNGAANSWASAEVGLYAAFDAATASIKKNGKTLDVHTAKGRANKEALLGIVDATDKAAQARYDETGSLDTANGVLEQGRKKLIAFAVAMGDSPKQAAALADALLKIPPITKAQINAPGLDESLWKTSQLDKVLNEIDGRNVTSSITVTTTHLGKVEKQLGIRNRWGGAYTHAADGVLRDAGIYAAVNSGARYAFAEPGTGGEAFVPKNGDYGRSTRIIDTTARWYGGHFAPGGAGGHGGGGNSSTYAPQVSYNVYPQRADFSVQDLQALQRAHDAQMRVGRRR